MNDSYFRCTSESATTGRYLAGPLTAGPWSPALQHGGPPNALAVTAAERLVRTETGRTDLVAVRLAADFVTAVPIAEIRTAARILRAARSAVLVEVVVSAGDAECLLGRVWFVRSLDTAEVRTADGAGLPPIPPAPSPLGIDFGYGASLDWRFVTGSLLGSGPSAAWVRPLTRLIDTHGDDLPGLARAVLVADSGSGISAVLDWAAWSFVNVDLDVHLARPFVGDWVLLDAVTQLGPNGSALARSTISDEHGVAGSGQQTLVLARR